MECLFFIYLFFYKTIYLIGQVEKLMAYLRNLYMSYQDVLFKVKDTGISV